MKARVRGEATFESAVAYWHAIMAELDKRGWNGCGSRMSNRWDWNGSSTATFALEAGMNARVFTDEAEAAMWLRHGLS